jgi:ribosomal protein S12 methylthiotransferase accessory factor YcaO
MVVLNYGIGNIMKGSNYLECFKPDDASDVKAILKLSDKKISVKKVIRKNKNDPGFDWIQSTVKCEKENKVSEGTGEHYLTNIAKIKAIGESIERFSLLPSNQKYWDRVLWGSVSQSYKQKNSNGVAFHFKPQNALESSILELIERHSVLKAWTDYEPVYVIKSRNKFISLSRKYSKLNGLNDYFLLVPNEFGIPTVACLIHNPNEKPYTFIGYSANLNIGDAIEKSFYEAWRLRINYFSISSHNEKASRNTFIEHFYAYANNKVNPCEIFNIKDSMNESRNIQNERIASNDLLNMTPINNVDIMDNKLIGLPGYTVRASSNDLVNLWNGKLKSKVGFRNAGDYHPFA